MERFFINTDLKDHKRLSYVVSVLNEHSYCKKSQVEFTLSEEEGDRVIDYKNEKGSGDFLVRPSEVVFEDFKGRLFINHYRFVEVTLYSVEKEKKDGGDFFSEGIFGFDIFETLFFHLSRYEELEIDFATYLGKKYEFESNLLLVENKLEKVPVVDHLISGFLKILLGREIEIEDEVSLSHDIDYITKFHSPLSIFRKVAGHIRHRKSLAGFPYLLSTYKDYVFNGQDAFDTFEWMLSAQEIDKTIYFLVGGKHKEDNSYDLDGKVFKKALRIAKELNYHVGIHPSYDSWNNRKLVDEEKRKLERVVGEEIVRSRQHFLNFDIKTTPEILQSLGIREDSSLAYTRHVGYRCGTGYPYRLYDFKNEKVFDVVERPLVFMDMAWLHEGIRKGKMVLPDLKQYYGTFNFHNSTFDEMGARNIAMKEHYLKFFR